MQIAKLGMRAKFLLVRLSIAAVLTTVVILVVRYQFAARAEERISGELQQCRERFLSLEAQTDAMRAQTAAILAATPEIYGALTSKDETQRELALENFAQGGCRFCCHYRWSRTNSGIHEIGHRL